MLRDSTTVAVVAVRTRPRAIPLAMIHMRKSIYGFPFVPLYGYGAPLGGLRPPELCYYNIQILCSSFTKNTSLMMMKSLEGNKVCSFESGSIQQRMISQQ